MRSFWVRSSSLSLLSLSPPPLPLLTPPPPSSPSFALSLVKNTLSLSLADLKSKFEVVTLPVTLVCAGNRRKEQNVVKKGLGFNWGAAGLSTGLFTGVYLADILAYAQPTPAPNGDRPRHVIFEGIDQLPQGPYGTVSFRRRRFSSSLLHEGTDDLLVFCSLKVSLERRTRRRGCSSAGR